MDCVPLARCWGRTFDRCMGMKQTGKPIVGLAGGIGSGKSTVAAILRDCGAAVIAADEISRRELTDPQVLRTIGQWWGDRVIDAADRPNRDEIRKIIKDDPTQRLRLEQLLHPRIHQRSVELLDRYQADPAVKAIVWDAPLLFEVGLERYCDAVIFVETDENTRLDRVARERGWSADDLRQLEKSQKPLDFKKQMSDYVINNSDNDDLRSKVESVFSKILAGSKP